MPTWYLAGNERYRGPVFSAASTAYQGPGDIVGGALFYGGLRAYTAAYAAALSPAIQVRMNSDNSTREIAMTSSGFADFATPTTGLNALATTGCYLSIIYDQRGTNHINFSVGSANAPMIKVDGLRSGVPCIYWQDSSVRTGDGASTISQAQPFMIFAVLYEETGGSTRFLITGAGVGAPDMHSASISSDSTTFMSASPTPSLNAWHATMGLYNSTSSVMNVDGTETADGTDINSVGLSSQLSLGQSTLGPTNLMRMMEVGAWPGTTFAGVGAGAGQTNRNLVISNMRSATSGWNF